MNPLTANQLSQGANQRLGNNVHHRSRRDRAPANLGIMQEYEAMKQFVARAGKGLPNGSIVHHSTGDYIVDRSDIDADNGGTMIVPEDAATARVFIAEADFIAQTTVNVAEGT